MSVCGIREFPVEILGLKKLRELRVNDNKIPTLPVEIDQLTNLEMLNISNNDIRRLVKELANMNQLRYIQCDGNPLVYPRRAVTQKGTNAIMTFLREMG
ncbi:MAG: hypothetical protein EZS28_039841 [Streblomastix strix]|uniref:Uncharacterized protein n=1 Tax=Streblomastix strix TaxID=222440 RepID=A0A5J4U3W8_9EUKA|nr:MAG: hypothetical protein EZS28_039841 [Streblomastix strix]